MSRRSRPRSGLTPGWWRPAGELFGDLLAGAGVPATLVPVAEPTRGTYTVVDPTAGDVLEVHEPSPALSASECDALVAAATRAAAGAAVVVIAGSLPAKAPPDLHARLLRACGAAFTVLDTSSPSALEAGLAAAPDLVAPNVAEAAALVGVADDDVLVAGAARPRRRCGVAERRRARLRAGDRRRHLAPRRPAA